MSDRVKRDDHDPLDGYVRAVPEDSVILDQRCGPGPGRRVAEPPKSDDMFGEVVSSYSRAQAIEDGVLVDVSNVAREAGLTYPVALTRAAWELCVTVPPKLQGQQDEAGRLWDVLWMLRINVGRGGDRLLYSLLVRTAHGRRRVTLKSICGPGDDPKPVITVMLPEED
jgi:hypothetical protein